MKVMHVAQPTSAGVARVVADLVAEQVQRDWRVVVSCPPEGDLPGWARDVGAQVVSWPAGRAPGPGLAGETRRLAGLVRRHQPDLLHLHSSKAGLAGRLGVRGRTPTVFQPHAWSFRAYDGLVGSSSLRWERFAVRWTDLLLVVSAAEQRQGLEAGVRAHYALAPNGVDADRRVRASQPGRARARQQLSLAPGPLVVCVGRLARQKGQDLLLAAWPLVVQAAPAAQLALVGDGPDERVLRERAPDSVRLVGPTSDVDTWLVAADVVVQPSRWEGASLALLEAMSAGRSVVAGRAEGMQEALRGDAGVVVDATDARALAAALVARLLDPALAEAEGRVGQQRAVAEFDLSVRAAAVADLYGQVLRTTPG